MSSQEIEQSSPQLSLSLELVSFSADSSSSNVVMDKEGEQIIEVVEDGEEGNVEDKEENLYAKKKRKKTSDVWQNFQSVKLADGSEKMQCNYCKTKLTKSATGTTTQFKRHLTSCPRYQLMKGQQQINVQHSVDESVSAVQKVQTWKYDHTKIREIVSHMIMVHELPFSFVEYDIFNVLMKATNPLYQKISRTTTKNDCATSYQVEKKRLRTMLQAVSSVSITTDLWKSGQKVQYMVVTCHFVDNWKLHKRVLNFVAVPPPHSGIVIHDALYKCLEEWEIEKKVATITVDNASYNDTAVRMLRDSLNFQRKLSCDGMLFHVRCCAHILNLLVQDGLHEIQHVIQNVRESVKYISASSVRLNIFSEITKQLQLPAKRLILDCCTRWNATYSMLACALEFRKVFPRYQERDSHYIYLPSEDDWDRVEDVCSFLALFNEVTNIISGTEYPTSNLFLPELTNIKEVLDERSVSGSDYMKEMGRRMKVKFDKYWGDCNLLISIAAILDPRNKMKLIDFSFHAIYSEEEANAHIVAVHDCLYRIYKEYVDAHAAASVEKNAESGDQDIVSASGVTTGRGKNIMSGRRKFDHYIRSVDTIENVKSELDVYLQEGVFICDDQSSGFFDALEWWKANNLKFRILSKMACDILAIPVTSVASEATFSAGGRVIDTYRSCLGIETVQILMCGEDWFRNFYGMKRKTKVIEDVKEIALP